MSAAERVDFATDEKLVALLRSRGVSQATYKAAVDMAEKDLTERKLMVDLMISHARLLWVGGTGFFALSITTLLLLHKLEKE